jgi:hypothetical protein
MFMSVEPYIYKAKMSSDALVELELDSIRI